jgi:hypothetical protein
MAPNDLMVMKSEFGRLFKEVITASFKVIHPMALTAHIGPRPPLYEVP